MRYFLLASIIFILASCSGGGRSGSPRILVFSATKGYRHESIELGKLALQKLGIQNDFKVDTTENPAYFCEDSLQHYAAVVFLSTTGNVLNTEQEAHLERFIQGGGGFVGIHAASDTEYDWPWYGRMVGGYFESHPAGVHDAKLIVQDKENLATKHLGSEWLRKDEWYNFKDLNPATKVLLTIDEKSYEGGKNGPNHPMSWYHDYDGGRAFYTALGHTAESYSEPKFLTHILGGIRYAIGNNDAIDYKAATSQVPPHENRFNKVVLSQGTLFEPTEMTILPNLDVLIAQRRGEILLYSNERRTTTQAGFLNVYHKTSVPGINAEEGVIGLAADPGFAKNKFIYIYYAPADSSVNQLSRFRFANGQIDMASEKVVLQVKSQRQICCHTGGSIAFDAEGLLYLSTGDNSTPFNEKDQLYQNNGYSPLDDRPGHLQYDGLRTSGNTNDLRGKIVRIKVNEDGSYDIPEGNLFPKEKAKTRPEIYAMGTRNPYRISVDQKRGWLFWGEVGPDAQLDDSLRGPRGHDEINRATKPGNFGYPMFLANNLPYRPYDMNTGKSGAPFNPFKPRNLSRNNTGMVDLPPAQEALIYYPYADSQKFPSLGSGGRNAMAGPIFYTDGHDANTRFPRYYNSKFFFYDWIRGWIKALTFDDAGGIAKIEPFMGSSKFNNIIDMELGPDGRLYLLEYGTGWFSKNPDAALSRIDYHPENLPPVPKILVQKASGELPLKIEASAAGTYDVEGDAISYLWSFGNGTTKVTKEPKVTYTYEVGGQYALSVQAIDAKGAMAQSTIETIYAGNDVPTIAIKLVGNQTYFFPEKPLTYSVEVQDAEDGQVRQGNPLASNIIFTREYVESKDLASMPAGHQQLTGVAAGKVAITNYDCKSCHKIGEKSVGPAYTAVADRYAGNTAAPAMLVAKIMKGGGGVWGDAAMAAHPNINPVECRQIVDYILSLSAKAPKIVSLPAAGKMAMYGAALTTIPLDARDLKCILQASYTDKGGNGLKPLSTAQTLVLKTPVFAAHALWGHVGLGIEKVMVAEKEEKWLSIRRENSLAFWPAPDLTAISNIAIAYKTVPGPAVPVQLSLHAGNPNGPLVGSVDITAAGKVGSRSVVTLPILASEAKPVDKLYFVFNLPAGSEKSNVQLKDFRLMAQ